MLWRTHILVLTGCALLFPSARASSSSYPAGVPYPLKAAALQPSGLAQSLPSTRRYILIWKDQLIPDGYTEAEKDWVVTHYIGSQKLFQRQVDDYRARNPEFLMLVYHLAFGLNGADQPNPVGNITSPNAFGQEDTDDFTPWVAANDVTREDAYQHWATPAGPTNRVSYPDPYWLMDTASPEWRAYLVETLLAWASFPTDKATGFFFDVAFPPWYQYSPASWWAQPAGGSSRQALLAWWSPRAQAYFDSLRTQFQPTAAHPRYLVLPNTDALVDSIDEPAYLEGTDGVFTENWQAVLANPGDWNLSVRRICQYVTGRGKVWMADVTVAGTALAPADRSLLIGTYLLVRNGTSYIMFGNADLTWYPEYEIDLGGYLAEPPTDLESLRVAGDGGANGGLYVRQYVAGTVLVNSSAARLSYTLTAAMNVAVWSGGGPIASDATQTPQSLTYSETVGPGLVVVPARSVLVLQALSGPPPPGVEPGDVGDAGVDAGTSTPDAGASGGPDGGESGPDGGPTNSFPTGVSSSCGCSSARSDVLPWLLVLVLGVRSRPRSARGCH